MSASNARAVTGRRVYLGPSLADTLNDGLLVGAETIAIEAPGGHALSYRELDTLSRRLADALARLDIGRGDRVGLYLPKSIEAIASIFGVLRAGAAYIPVDPGSPPARASLILDDCALSALITTETLLERLSGADDAEVPHVPILALDGVGAGDRLAAALDAGFAGEPRPAPAGPPELAYILYTSGSTGRPKGVMLSHENAMSFVDWCSRAFEPTAADRFSSHAPLHFDLSILDVFVPLRHGATLVLFDAEEGRNPRVLAQRIEEARITTWYSAPSILSMLAQFGRLEDRDFSPLRRILFAGEVFPIKHLRQLQRLLPGREYHNLYGPTETNVCTAYRIPDEIPEERADPYPIGAVCDHFWALVVDDEGREVETGREGELCIAGPGVMLGYWNRPEATEAAFLERDGARWYRTGDVVRANAAGDFIFAGRRDRMVKRRGYRIELGEVEAGLYRYPGVCEVAAVSVPDGEGGVRIRAVMGFGDAPRPSLIALKAFAAKALPVYMVPDDFVLGSKLPRTSTDKIDLQKLLELR